MRGRNSAPSASAPEFWFAFTDCNLKLGSQEVHLRAGETKWIAESRRVTTNLGAQAQMLYIESKTARR